MSKVFVNFDWCSNFATFPSASRSPTFITVITVITALYQFSSEYLSLYFVYSIFLCFLVQCFWIHQFYVGQVYLLSFLFFDCFFVKCVLIESGYKKITTEHWCLEIEDAIKHHKKQETFSDYHFHSSHWFAHSKKV